MTALSSLSADQLETEVRRWLPGPSQVEVHAALAELVRRLEAAEHALEASLADPVVDERYIAPVLRSVLAVLRGGSDT